jgi:hypothetical protein
MLRQQIPPFLKWFNEGASEQRPALSLQYVNHWQMWSKDRCAFYACFGAYKHYTVLHLLRHVSVFSRYRLTHGKQTRKRRRFAATDREQGVLLSPSFINIVIGYLSNTGPISISHASSPVSLHATDLEHTQDVERNYCAAPEYGTCHGQNWGFCSCYCTGFHKPRNQAGDKSNYWRLPASLSSFPKHDTPLCTRVQTFLPDEMQGSRSGTAEDSRLLGPFAVLIGT